MLARMYKSWEWKMETKRNDDDPCSGVWYKYSNKLTAYNIVLKEKPGIG